MKRLAIFVSGNGTNMERIATYFKDNKEVEIAIVYCNNPLAGAIERAKRLDIPTKIIDREQFRSDGFVHELKQKQIDLIVLAGFLWLIPSKIVVAFANQIINIHPALLPNYGGKGMYGEKVHEAVVAAKEEFSGITIHYVNENYDEGATIFQANVALSENETPDTLAKKIHQLEYEYFPKVIETLLFPITKDN